MKNSARKALGIAP